MSNFEYVKLMNIRKFFVNVRGFYMCVGIQLWRVINIPGFRVCQGSGYATVTQGSEYAWMWLNNAPRQGSGCLVDGSQGFK